MAEEEETRVKHCKLSDFSSDRIETGIGCNCKGFDYYIESAGQQKPNHPSIQMKKCLGPSPVLATVSVEICENYLMLECSLHSGIHG